MQHCKIFATFFANFILIENIVMTSVYVLGINAFSIVLIRKSLKFEKLASLNVMRITYTINMNVQIGFLLTLEAIYIF